MPESADDGASEALRSTRRTLAAFIGGHFALVIILGAVLFYFGRPAQPGPESFSKPSVSVERFIRNLSWETPFSKNSAFRKGDSVELFYSIDASGSAKASMDVTKLEPVIEIERVEADGKEIPKDALASRRFGRTGILKITGKAKTDAMALPADPSELAVIPEENVATEENQTGALNPDEPTEKPASPARVERVSYSLDTSNLIRILDAPPGIGSVMVGDRGFPGSYERGSYVFVVGRREFWPGERFVALHMKDGSLVAIESKVSFEGGNSTIGVSAVTPGSISGTKDAYVTLQGYGFSKIISLQLQNGIVIKNASFTIVNDSVMFVRIPAWLVPGSYVFNVMDVSGIHTPARARFSVTP